MTKSIPKQNLLELLINELDYTEKLIISAANMFFNFTWLDVHQKNYIPLLDYDILRYAFPSIAVKRDIELRHSKNIVQESTESTDADVLSLHNFIGPHTLSVLLESIVDYCLPEGAVAELLIHIEKQKRELSAEASDLLQTIERGLHEHNPVEMILNDSFSWKEKTHIILKEIEEVITGVHELDIYESILTCNTPIKELTGTQTDTESLKAYREASLQLNSQRPLKNKNNYHDALNYALFVKAFNNQIRKVPMRGIPLMFSNTNIMLSLNVKNWIHGNEIDDLRLLNNSHYLVMDQFLLNYCDKNYKMAANESSEIGQCLRAMYALLKQMIDACKKHTEQGKPESDLTEEDLPKYEREMFQHYKERLTQRWRPIFDVPLRSIACDRIEYLNKILIEQANHSGYEAALVNLKDIIYKHKNLYDSIWMPIQRRAETDIPHLSYKIFNIEVSLMQNEGLLLTEIDPQKSAIGLDEMNKQKYDIFVCGHFKNHSISGALFTLGIYKNHKSSERYITFIWQYGTDRLTIMNYGIKLMELFKDSDDLKLDCKIYTQEEEIDIEYVSVENIVKKTEKYEYDFIKMRIDGVSFQADIYPVEHRELQAIYRLPESKWSMEVLNLLVGAISNTHFFTLPFNTYREAIEKAANKLKLKKNE